MNKKQAGEPTNTMRAVDAKVLRNADALNARRPFTKCSICGSGDVDVFQVTLNVSLYDQSFGCSLSGFGSSAGIGSSMREEKKTLSICGVCAKTMTDALAPKKAKKP